jgi:hypothetical protein
MTQVVEEPGTAGELLRPRDTPARRVHDVLHRLPVLSSLVVLILACIVVGPANGRFFRPRTCRSSCSRRRSWARSRSARPS